MSAVKSVVFLFSLLFLVNIVLGQYENERCKCICPSLRVVANQSIPGQKDTDRDDYIDRKVYIDLVPPLKCNCDGLVLPKLSNEVKSKEFCPLCECRFESRNKEVIKYVIIGFISVIMMLVAYMSYLLLLDPYLHRPKGGVRTAYHEQINEELSLEEPCSREMNTSTSPVTEPTLTFSQTRNVLDRVSHQQTIWKKQVIEQRKNIYDKHIMLN